MSKLKKVRRNFTIDTNLLNDFKKVSKESSKTYRRTIEEAIELWLKQQKERV